MTPIIVLAGVAAVAGLVKLFKKKKSVIITTSFVPFVPPPAATAPTPTALDDQGFPPIVSQAITPAAPQQTEPVAVTPAAVGPVQDTFRDANTGLSNQNGPDPITVDEPQSFFDSLNFTN